MFKNKTFWIMAVLVIAVLSGVLFWRKAVSARETVAQATYRVQRGPLTVSVIQAGTIKAREMTIIKNEVEGRTSIITLVPEGTRVRKGDLLVELDASELIDNRLDQQIRVQNAEAAYVGANENLAVVKNQAQSDVDKAELVFQFAKEDLQNYIDGEYPNQLKQAEANIALAKEELTRAQETLRWSKTLFEEKFISQTELQADELNETKKKLDLDLAQNNLNLLTEFTNKRNLAQLKSDVSQAEMALERTTRKARADVVQAEADLMAKESEYNRQKDRLQKIEEQIKKATIYAPSDGLVIYATSAMTGGRRFNVEPLIEGREVREREELIYLPTTASVKAEVSIHESNLEKVREGLPAIITVDALPGRKYLGQLVNIAPLPDAQSMWMNPDLKVYNSEIYLEDTDDALRTGMGCQAEIIVAKYDDVMYVPVQSVIRVQGQPTVFVVRGKALEERRVEIGLDNNLMVHILSGLSEGQEVLLTPPLKAGIVDSAGSSKDSAEHETMQQRIRERLDNHDISSTPAEGSNSVDVPSEAGSEKSISDTPVPPPPVRSSEQMRQRLENMTPEQREQMRKRFEQMTPEQREQMRQRMRQEQQPQTESSQ